MAGQVTIALDAVTTAQNTGVFRPQRVKEETGVVTIAFSGTSFTLNVQGRPEPGQSWFTIATFTQASPALDAQGCSAQIVALFPEMRFQLSSIVSGTLTATLIE